MNTIGDVLGQDHAQLDAELAAAKAAATRQDRSATQEALARFSGALLRHIAVEEETLFPAFEAATGMTDGPTEVMRFEHGQMRHHLRELEVLAVSGDLDQIAATLTLLESVLQLHNPKEERMLYPMCDRALLVRKPEVLEQIQAALSAAAN